MIAFDDNEKHPILVCGAHRSGTTWVGKMLSASGEAVYISEPLNVWHRRGVFRAPVRRWYQYICPDNEGEYQTAMNETLNFRYHPWLELKSLRSVKDIMRMGRDWLNFLYGNLFHLRPIIKDPFSVFSIPWFFDRFHCRIVVTIRHPAGFVSSLTRLGWRFDLFDLLNQPLLMRDWLEPYRKEIQTALENQEDLVAQASLLWRMIYHVVGSCQARSYNLILIRHEDLSLAPVEGFRNLYAKLGLGFNSRAVKAVTGSSEPTNPVEASPNKVHSVKLDSRSNLDYWKRRLSALEIERIYRLTQDVARNYYSDQEWT